MRKLRSSAWERGFASEGRNVVVSGVWVDGCDRRGKRCRDKKSKSWERFRRRVARSSVLGGEGKIDKVWDSVFVAKSLEGDTESEEGCVAM